MNTMKWLFLLLGALAMSVSALPVRPNIVFIMADDLGWQDVGFMGSDWFETPLLDRLAAESVVFDQALMYPTCSPSRAALLTGRHSFRTGVYTVPVLEGGNAEENIYSRWTVGLEHPFYSDMFNRAGYRLIHLGKWHLVGPDPAAEQAADWPLDTHLEQPPNGDVSWLAAHRQPKIQRFYPQGRGFHENVGGTWWGDPARGYEDGYRAPGGGYVAPFRNPFIGDRKSDGWLTDRLTDDAIDFIHRNQDQPFFVNLHYYAPHRPTVMRSHERFAYYMNKAGDPQTGQGFERKAELAAYATMVESIDANVQRILDALDELGLREKTMVVFTSDNGFNGLQSGTRNLRGAKGTVYEGGLRVPALVHWQGVISPRRVEQPVCGLDWFPTFVELAGAQHDDLLDGVSLVPLLSGGTLADRTLYWQLSSGYKQPACTIMRAGHWKLVEFLVSGDLELYDLENDPTESANLADKFPEVAGQMLREMRQWRAQENVPLPLAVSAE